MIKVTVRTERARRRLDKLKNELTPKKMDAAVAKTAAQVFADAVARTKSAIKPGRFNVARPEDHWRMKHVRPGVWSVNNDSAVTRYLDEGTIDHGPVTAKFLYIPLVRRAVKFIAGQGFKRGVDFILTKHVRGIRPRRFIDKIRANAKKFLAENVLAVVKKAAHG